MKHKDYSFLTPICQLISYVLLIISLLVLTYVGCKIFCLVTDNQQANDNQRNAVSYIQSQVKASDKNGNVVVCDGPCGTEVDLLFAESEYKMVVYAFDGYLMEETLQKNAEIDPLNAVRITKADLFEAEIRPDGLMSFSIDNESGYVTIHCNGGAE